MSKKASVPLKTTYIWHTLYRARQYGERLNFLITVDIKEYKSSGIIELYVLNLLSAADQAAVEKYANEFPEMQQEIESLQKALEIFAKSFAILPGAALKQKIIEKIKSESTRRPVSGDLK